MELTRFAMGYTPSLGYSAQAAVVASYEREGVMRTGLADYTGTRAAVIPIGALSERAFGSAKPVRGRREPAGCAADRLGSARQALHGGRWPLDE